MFNVVDKKMLEDVVKEAINLLEYDNKSDGNTFLIVLKNIIKRLLKTANIIKENYYLTWRTGILVKSLLLVRNECKEIEDVILDSVRKYFDRFIKKGQRIGKVDHIQNGESCLMLYFITGDAMYKILADSYKSYLQNLKTDSSGSIPFLSGDFIYVDGLMICPFMLQYAKLNNDTVLYNEALKQFLNFIKYGMDINLGLPYHGYNLKDDLQYGIPGWGRGVGWFLYSISASIDYFEFNNPQEIQIIESFRQVIDRTIKYQNSNGLFNWFLITQKGPIDTSATAMILYSVARAINKEVLDAQYKKCVVNGYKSLCGYVNQGKVKQAMGDCAGFSMYPQFKYDSYPWSVAFFLLLSHEVIAFKD